MAIHIITRNRPGGPAVNGLNVVKKESFYYRSDSPINGRRRHWYRYGFYQIFLLVWALLALGSCASTKLPPVGSVKHFQPEEDEKQLWKDSEQLEQVYEKKGLLYKDPELDIYLNAIAAKLIGRAVQDAGVKPQIKVVQNPLLNAFALPNGVILIQGQVLTEWVKMSQKTHRTRSTSVFYA